MTIQERIAYLPIDGIGRIVYSVPLELTGDETLIVSGQFEVTNKNPFNVGIGRGISISDSPDTRGTFVVARGAMENVTPDIHHLVGNPSAICKPGMVGQRWLHLALWAVASRASAGDLVIVEQGYGHLQVVKV